MKDHRLRKLKAILGLSLTATVLTPAIASTKSMSLASLLRGNAGQVIQINNVKVVGDKRLIPIDLQNNFFIRPLAHHQMTLSALLFRLNYIQEFYHTLGEKNALVTVSERPAKGKQKNLVISVVDPKGDVYLNKLHHSGYSTGVLKDIYGRLDRDHNRVLSNEDIIRSMLLANNVPGVISTYTMTPVGKNTYDLDTLSQFRRGSVYAGLSNVGQAPSGRDLYSLGGTVNDLIGGDQLSADGSISNKPKRSAFFQIAYKKLIGPYGTELRLYYSYNHGGTNPLIFYQFTSNGRRYRVSVFQPLMMDLKNRAGLQLGYEVFNGSNDGAAQGQFADLVTTETIPFVYALFNYQRFEEIGRFWGTAELAHGVGGLFGTKASYVTRGLANQFQSPFVPKKIFTRFTFDANQQFDLPKNLGLLLSTRGQGAFNSPQFISQKFSYASGAYIGQGYLGDNAIAGRIEAQYNVPLSHRFFERFQLFGFYGIGYMTNPKQSLVDYENADPSSYGGGIRLSVLRYLNGFVEVAKPITEVLSESGNKDLRFFYGISMNY